MKKSKIPISEQIAMRRAGFTITAIAQRAGIHESTLRSRFKQWGIVPEGPVMYSSRTLTAEYAELLDRMYWLEGMSTADIGKALGKSPTRILNQMRDLGIPRRERSEAVKLAIKTDPRKGERPWVKGKDMTHVIEASRVARRKKAEARRRREARKAKAASAIQQ